MLTLHHAGSSVDASISDSFPARGSGGQTLTVGQVGVVSSCPLVQSCRCLDELNRPSCCTAWRPLIVSAASLRALKHLSAAVSPSGKERSDCVSPDPI